MAEIRLGNPDGLFHLRIPIYTPELEVLMADVKQVLTEFHGLKTDLTAKLDSIDNVIEELRGQVAAGQVDQAVVDQLASEVADARESLDSVNPEDPSGDDTPPAGGGGDGV